MSKPYADALRRVALMLAVVTLCGCASPAKPKPEKLAAAAPAAAQIPDRAREAYARAIAAMRKSDWTAAQGLLQSLVDSNPELPGPAVNLGIVYGHLNRPADARKMLESAAARWPDFAPAQHQLGLLLRDQGEFAAADAAYARALAADPEYAVAYYDRAVLNDLYLQQPQLALQNYEQFQRLRPKEDEQVARWIVDLRRRTNAPQPAAKPATKGAPA